MILLFGKTWELSSMAPKLEFIESTDNDRDLTRIVFRINETVDSRAGRAGGATGSPLGRSDCREGH